MGNPVLGVLAGATWNLASLWCLTRLLRAWLGPQPSRRRVLLWLLVKFPLLYLLVFLLLRQPAISVVGFGVGFSLALLVVVGWLLRQAVQMSPIRPHGR